MFRIVIDLYTIIVYKSSIYSIYCLECLILFKKLFASHPAILNCELSVELSQKCVVIQPWVLVVCFLCLQSSLEVSASENLHTLTLCLVPTRKLYLVVLYRVAAED